MKFIKFTFFLFLVGMFGQAEAQVNIHWTLYNMSPLTLNPAHTGAYLGTARVGGIFRDQANIGAPTTGYQTPSFYLDAPILRVGKTDWLGVGGVFYSDKAGSAALTNQGALASVAYHKSLDKKGKTLLSFGIQVGLLQKRIDQNKLRFGDEVLGELETGTFVEISQNRADLENTSSPDLNAGIMLTTKVGKKSSMNLGFSVNHVLTPTYTFNPNLVSDVRGERDLPLSFNLHGQFDLALNEKWRFSPSILYNKVYTSSDVQLQTLFGYVFNEKDPLAIKFGPGYRFGDALEALLMFEYRTFKIGASYDYTLSDLSNVNNGMGAFELALSYVIRISKAPKVKPVIICPRL